MNRPSLSDCDYDDLIESTSEAVSRLADVDIETAISLVPVAVAVVLSQSASILRDLGFADASRALTDLSAMGTGR